MNATNYCAEYIDAARKTPAADSKLRQANLTNIDRAVKFRLPDDGLLFGETMSVAVDFGILKIKFAKYISHVKLPYESVALEFPYAISYENKSIKSKSIIVAENINNGIAFTTVTIFPEARGKTVLAEDRLIVFIDEALNIEVLSHKEDNRVISASDQARAHHFSNVVLGFVAALECSNTVTIDRPASNLLNKKRIKKGKQPFFSYKVLTIDTKADAKQRKGGVGTGNTKRVHLRRGHIRRLPDKTVWVNPCVVGDKSKGMVTKDYKVK